MNNTFNNFDTVADPVHVRKCLEMAAVNVWGIVGDEIEINIAAATAGGNLWAPDACRALRVDGRSQQALESDPRCGRAMGELCETANAIVAVLVGRHPAAQFENFERQINGHVLEFAARLAA